MTDRDAIVRGLVAAGVPRWKAEREADFQIADAARVAALPSSPFARMIEHPLQAIPAPTIHFGPPPAPPRWPFRLVLPWSHLISDNRKYCPALRGGKPAIILTSDYRNAKRLAGIAARKAWGDAVPYADGLLELTARVYFPNDYRKRDAHNFQKCAHDALKGIVIEDDDILVPRWIPAGVDVDAPRAELTIHPYPPV